MTSGLMFMLAVLWLAAVAVWWISLTADRGDDLEALEAQHRRALEALGRILAPTNGDH